MTLLWKRFVPCHYDCGALLSKRFVKADIDLFKREVEKMGIQCNIMRYGDEITA